MDLVLNGWLIIGLIFMGFEIFEQIFVFEIKLVRGAKIGVEVICAGVIDTQMLRVVLFVVPMD